MTLEEGMDARALVIRAAIVQWADENPWCDTQGVMGDEWDGMATAALDGLLAGFEITRRREAEHGNG